MIYRRKEMDLLCHNSIFGTICMKFRKANGLQQNETFRKAQCPIVECLTNSSMMHGRNNGKKVGPAVGISTGNELRVACCILERITEIAGVLVSFDPKLILVNFLSFNHVNDVSRIKDEILNMVTGTRLVLLVIIAHSVKEKGEYKVIKKAIEKMGLRHKEPIAAYRDGNERRLTRFHETTDINTFLMWQIYSCGT